MFYYIAKGIYTVLGWKIDREIALNLWEKKNVVIGFPHTSMIDTVVTMVGMHILGKTSYTFIKKEMFFWPLSWLLRMNNAVPIDRHASRGVVDQIVEEFERHDQYSVNIVPQGTRASVSTMRTGFWHIAKQANASILCWYFDSTNKKCVCLGKLRPGDSVKMDINVMQTLYNRVGYTLPGIK